MQYEYLYIYRQSNTVIQLYRESEDVFILSDGEWYDELDLSDEENKRNLEDFQNGARYVWLKFKSGDFWEVYTNPATAFGL